MLIWIFLLVLMAVEALAIGWWLHREFLPVFFNGWAALLYSVLIAVDLLLAWLVSLPFAAAVGNLALLPVCSVALVLLVGFFTLFFRWVVRQDMSEPPSNR